MRTFFVRLAAAFLACVTSAPVAAMAQTPKFIVVRLDEVRILDDTDGNEGECRYVVVGSTGNHGEEPIIVQQMTFPMENWYECSDDGVNATFLRGHDRALPIFVFPEAGMGDDLTITVGVFDDDENSDFVVLGHEALATIGTAVATYYGGPATGALVDALSSAVQRAIEEGGETDVIGTVSVALTRSDDSGDTFGMPAGEHYRQFEVAEGDVRIKFSVMRIAQPEAYNDWLFSVRLDRIHVIDDSDDGTQGAGDIYVRARVAHEYATGLIVRETNTTPLDETATFLPRNGYTRDVDTGDDFPIEDVMLYTNASASRNEPPSNPGLPVFLYVEVDVFEDDNQIDCSGRSCDDVLGVLPVMFTNRWLREHEGSNQLSYTVRGDSGRARIDLTIDVWNPNADPDAPIDN